MKLKFNLLIHNEQLITDEYVVSQDKYIINTLNNPLYLPNTEDKQFIFSCFALSVDGKLCYPDQKSGFTIAKNNQLASDLECYADWWCLSLARAISDAVIIGGNSLLLEHNQYAAKLDIPDLVKLRESLGLNKYLLHIIIVRDANKINWQDELVYTDPLIPLVVYCEKLPELIPEKMLVGSNYEDNRLKQFVVHDSLDVKNFLKNLHAKNIKTILNESPFYHHYLQEHKLLNESWLNTSGVYIGGNIVSLGMQNVPFNSYNHPHYTIFTLHHIANNFLYTRYKINY